MRDPLGPSLCCPQKCYLCTRLVQSLQKMRYIGYTSKLSNFNKSGKIRGISKQPNISHLCLIVP